MNNSPNLLCGKNECIFMSIQINTKGENVHFSITNYDKVIGVAHGVYYIEEDGRLRNGKIYRKLKAFYIQSIHIDESFRGLGNGNKLMKGIINYVKNNNMDVIYLDDMSQRSRTFHNLYVKNGFKYQYDHGPEMVLYL